MDQPNPRLGGRIDNEPPSNAPRCDFCREALTTVQEFVYQVESFNFVDDPVQLEIIRRLPTYRGEPLRLCQDCHASIETNIREIEVEAAAGAKDLSIAWKLFLCLMILPLAMLLVLLLVIAVVDNFR